LFLFFPLKDKKLNWKGIAFYVESQFLEINENLE
jgi:hypothetical protein